MSTVFDDLDNPEVLSFKILAPAVYYEARGFSGYVLVKTPTTESLGFIEFTGIPRLTNGN